MTELKIGTEFYSKFTVSLSPRVSEWIVVHSEKRHRSTLINKLLEERIAELEK